MKKTLLVLGLALLATVATAQTNFSSRLASDCKMKANVERTEAPSVDYKASIFTKAYGNNVGDTIVGGYWNFDDVILSNGDTNSGYVFADAGRILTGVNDSIWMQDATQNNAWVKSGYNPHNVLGDGGLFQFVDSNSHFFNVYGSNYAGGTLNWPATRFVSYVFDNTHQNYFMIYLGGPTPTEGIQHHAFFKLPAIANPQIGHLYQVRLRQDTYKFIERTFIDFKVGTEWYAIETNVEGVDAPHNDWNSGARSYTLPALFGQQSTLEIRFRVYNDNILGDVYGIYYAFDDVAIVNAASYHWANNDDVYIDGAYGTIPVGMNIPLSWFGQVNNDGAFDIANPTAQVYHYSPTGTKTLLTSKVADPIAAGSGAQYLTINERGFLDSVDWDGWFGYATTYGDSVLPASYGAHGLPSDAANIGTNFVTISGVVPGNSNYDTLQWDTIGYRVVDINGGDDTNNNLIEGYRFAHDNGVIPSNSLYSYGLYYQGSQLFRGNGAPYDARGYAVRVRYTTPDVIPTDPDSGEPWVIKGIELVPQTDTTDTAIVGSVIQPLLYKIFYNDTNPGSSGVLDVNTGLADDYTYTVKYKDINSSLNNARSGRIAPGDDYKAVNIRFAGQPALEPNTAYWVGYTMAEDGYFGVAQNHYGYTDASGASVRYYQDPDLAPYYYQFKASDYDVISTTPGISYTYWAAYYGHTNWPLIRLIVGPREELDEYNIDAVCTDTNYIIRRVLDGYYVNMCGDTMQAYEGSDATVYVWPTGDSTSVHPGVIDTIIIDGERIAVDDIDEYDDYIISEEIETLRNASGDVLLHRAIYIVTFTGLSGDHTVSAVGHAYPFNLGIESEAVEVSLGLKPNPATNSVTLNMRGVEGMVNCSIIDMSGRVVYNRTINAESAQTIDLSNVAAGAYFVRVTNDKFSKVEKLIVR